MWTRRCEGIANSIKLYSIAEQDLAPRYVGLKLAHLNFHSSLSDESSLMVDSGYLQLSFTCSFLRERIPRKLVLLCHDLLYRRRIFEVGLRHLSRFR